MKSTERGALGFYYLNRVPFSSAITATIAFPCLQFARALLWAATSAPEVYGRRLKPKKTAKMSQACGDRGTFSGTSFSFTVTIRPPPLFPSIRSHNWVAILPYRLWGQPSFLFVLLQASSSAGKDAGQTNRKLYIYNPCRMVV